MKGSTFKRCKCRDAGGRELGTKCPTLHRADGSHNPNHGTWYFRLELEPDAEGKRRTVRRGGFDKQEHAQAALEEARGKDAKGVDVTRKVTVSTYLAEWLAGADLRETTRRGYTQLVNDHLVPHLGRVEISQLRRANVETMFAAIDADRAERKAKPMGAPTKQRVRAVLRSALSDAEREGLVVQNAAKLARVPSGKRPKVRPLEPAELGKLLDHLASDPMGAFYEVVAATGLRRGEALALRWDDVDLTDGVLTVRSQLVQVGGGMHPCPYCKAGHRGMSWGKPKTRSGEDRRVELTALTVGALMEHRLRQDGHRERWGDAYADHGLLFTRDDGTPIYGDDVTKRFGELCDAAGVRPGCGGCGCTTSVIRRTAGLCALPGCLGWQGR